MRVVSSAAVLLLAFGARARAEDTINPFVADPVPVRKNVGKVVKDLSYDSSQTIYNVGTGNASVAGGDFANSGVKDNVKKAKSAADSNLPTAVPPKTNSSGLSAETSVLHELIIPAPVEGLGVAQLDSPSLTGVVQSMVQNQGSPRLQDQGVREIRKAVADNPDKPQIARYAVQELSRAGDEDAALRIARAGLAVHPDDRDLGSFVAMHEQAAAAATTAKERAKELLAGLRGDAGAPPPGAAVEAGLIPGMGLGAAALSPANRAALAAGLSAAESVQAGEALKEAVNKFRLGDDPAALAALDRRLKENPSDAQALRLRALVRRHAGDLNGSLSDARAAEALAPWDSRAKRLELDDLTDLGRPAQALQEADAALAASPRDAQVLAARGRVWESLGKPEKALADYQAAAEADAVFDGLYRDARSRLNAPASNALRPRMDVVWLGVIGTALLFFSFALFRRRGESSVRYAMRAEDHELLARGARPDAAPQGFRILRTLGQGGMGVVYEALDEALQRPVALKKLRAEIADNPRERARFLKEARTVAALKHPNIVEIHAIHEGADGLFLVFEKVPGETLHERLGRGPLAPAEAVAYLRQVAKALDHAHGQGVVHQDLKPANVMVAGDSAKVMDFGIARRVAETLSTLSRVEVAGTPAYMAPEQESGGPVGPAADVFALGACAYELLVGRTPFPSGGMMMKAQRMYRPLAEVRPDLAPAADAALARALDPEPGLRWPSASSFVEAFARSLAAA